MSVGTRSPRVCLKGEVTTWDEDEERYLNWKKVVARCSTHGESQEVGKVVSLLNDHNAGRLSRPWRDRHDDEEPEFSEEPMVIEVEHNPLGTIDRITIEVTTFYVAPDDQVEHPRDEDHETTDFRAEFVVEDGLAKWDRFGETTDPSIGETDYDQGFHPEAIRAAIPAQALVKQVPDVEKFQSIEAVLQGFVDEANRLYNSPKAPQA